MEQVFHYKIWSEGLGQYVVQREQLPAAAIGRLGGVVIGEDGRDVMPPALSGQGRMQMETLGPR